MVNETEPTSVKESMDSKFRYVLLVAERAEQLMRGARAKVDAAGKPTRVAREEIDQGLVEWGYGAAPEPELEALPEEPAEAEEEAAEDQEAESASESEVH